MVLFLFRPSVVLLLILIHWTGLIRLSIGQAQALPLLDMASDEGGGGLGQDFVRMEEARALAEMTQRLRAQLELKTQEGLRSEAEWVRALYNIFPLNKGPIPGTAERFRREAKAESTNDSDRYDIVPKRTLAAYFDNRNKMNITEDDGRELIDETESEEYDAEYNAGDEPPGNGTSFAGYSCGGHGDCEFWYLMLGIGFGLGVLAVVLGFLVWFLLRRCSRRETSYETDKPHREHPDDSTVTPLTPMGSAPKTPPQTSFLTLKYAKNEDGSRDETVEIITPPPALPVWQPASTSTPKKE